MAAIPGERPNGWSELLSYLDRIPQSESQLQFEAILNAVSPGDLIDLGGAKFVFTTPPIIDKSGLTIVNFDFEIASSNKVFENRGDGNTFVNGRSKRTNVSNTITDPSAARSNIHNSGENSTFIDVDIDGANLANLYSDNGVSNLTVKGGRYRNISLVQNSAAVLTALGTELNDSIIVNGIELSSDWNASNGVLLFSPSNAHVSNNKLAHLRQPSQFTLIGWSFISGNVWRTADRTDASTTVVRNNSVQMAEPVAGTNPGANQWSRDSGFIYVNLSGVDPNTRTMTSDVLGGYGVTFYANSDVQATDFNFAESNDVRDCDGFGIYFQLASIAKGNRTSKNSIQDAFLSNHQSDALANGAIGVSKGIGTGDCRTALSGDVVDGSNSYGVHCSQANVSGSGGAILDQVNISNCLESGIWAETTALVSVINSESYLNVKHGATAHASGTLTRNVEFINFKSEGNTLRGLNLDNTGSGIITARISGGRLKNNGSEDIRITGIQNSTIENRVEVDTSGIVLTTLSGTLLVDQPVNSPVGPQIITSDAVFTLTPFISPVETIHTGTLTANRVVTLSTTNAYKGCKFMISRTGGGAFNLDIGGLKNLATGQWCVVVFNGTIWTLFQFGSL